MRLDQKTKDISKKITSLAKYAYKSMGFCDFAVVYESGYVKYWSSQACHAMVNRAYKEVNDIKQNPVTLIISVYNKRHSKQKRHKEFAQWLVSRSPWRDAFLNKDWQSVYEYGFLIDTSQPCNYVQSALIASRAMGDRYSQQIDKTWLTLVRRGFDPTIAYFLCYTYNLTSVRGKANVVIKSSESGLHGGHCPFHNHTNPEYLIRMVQHSKENSGFKYAGESYNTLGLYKDVEILWGDCPDYRESILSKLNRYMSSKKIKCNDGWSSIEIIPLNIFHNELRNFCYKEFGEDITKGIT